MCKGYIALTNTQLMKTNSREEREVKKKKKNMANSSSAAEAAFSDEIPNKKNKGTCIINFPFSPALPSCSIFDMIPPSQSDQKASSFAGYIDLLSTNDFTSSSTLFDWFPTIDVDMSPPPPSTSTTQVNPQLPPLPVVEPSPAASEVLNNPATPVSVSSSISSSSNETGVANKVTVAENEHEHEEELEGDEADEKDEDHGIRLVENQNDQDQNQTKKLLKPRKKNSKKERQARVTFKTKSEVDHMDDGYRWRKYGQKPVKNSPFPRSYYRCTAASCEVKKRIERSAADSSIVLTSYEGQHTHLSPVLLRAANLGIMPDPSGFQEQIHQHQITTSGVGSSVLGNEFAISKSQEYQQLQDQYRNVINQERKAVPSLLYNTDYNNSFNVSPLLNVVNSADNFLNYSKSFGGFHQNEENYGGGNSSVSSSMLTANDPVRNNNGLLQDMFVPMEMGGAGAGAGAGEGR